MEEAEGHLRRIEAAFPMEEGRQHPGLVHQVDVIGGRDGDGTGCFRLRVGGDLEDRPGDRIGLGRTLPDIGCDRLDFAFEHVGRIDQRHPVAGGRFHRAPPKPLARKRCFGGGAHQACVGGQVPARIDGAEDRCFACKDELDVCKRVFQEGRDQPGRIGRGVLDRNADGDFGHAHVLAARSWQHGPPAGRKCRHACPCPGEEGAVLSPSGKHLHADTARIKAGNLSEALLAGSGSEPELYHQPDECHAGNACKPEAGEPEKFAAERLVCHQWYPSSGSILPRNTQ